MSERMSNERLAELREMATSTGLTYGNAVELLAEMDRLRKLEDGLDTEWGLVPDHADPDCSRSTGTGEYGRTEARINQQMYHYVTQRPIGKWRIAES